MASLETAMAEAAEAIRSASSLAITGHVSPDGDALGSALGLAHAARDAGVPAVVAFGGPAPISDSLRFLDLSPVVEAEEFPEEPECAVVFDTASADRLGDLAPRVNRSATVVVVDHHLEDGAEFGDIRVIDPTAAASAELAVLLIDAIGWAIGPVAAQCLLTGIVTDTGRFQYSATGSATMRLAARLLDLGAHPEIIGQHVYESVPFGYLKVSAAVLGRAVLEPDLGLVWSWVEERDVRSAGVSLGDLDGLIDDLRVAREAGVAALLKQTASGWKVSLRSRGQADVAAVAARHGGGGHHNAAGFTMDADRQVVVEAVRSGLRG